MNSAPRLGAAGLSARRALLPRVMEEVVEECMLAVLPEEVEEGLLLALLPPELIEDAEAQG